MSAPRSFTTVSSRAGMGNVGWYKLVEPDGTFRGHYRRSATGHLYLVSSLGYMIEEVTA